MVAAGRADGLGEDLAVPLTIGHDSSLRQARHLWRHIERTLQGVRDERGGVEMTTTESPEVELLRSRVDKLEQRVRMVVMGWVLGVTVFLLLGVAVRQAISQPEVLRARRIEVVDAAGRARISLLVAPDGNYAQFLLQGAAGESIGLAVFADRTLSLSLADATRVRLQLALHRFPDGSGLTLYDAAGEKRIVLALSNLRQTLPPYKFVNGPPSLMLYDAAGRLRFEAP